MDAQDVQFSVENRKLQDYLTNHPDERKYYPSDTRFSLVFIKYDANGTGIITNQQPGVISLSEQETSFSVPEDGAFLTEQTVQHVAQGEIRHKIIVLHHAVANEVVYEQAYTGTQQPQLPDSAYSQPGNYTIIWQSAGPTNELFSDDVLLKQSVFQFVDAGRKQKDNSFSFTDVYVPEGNTTGTVTPPPGSGRNNTLLVAGGVGGAAGIVIVLVIVLLLRRRAGAT